MQNYDIEFVNGVKIPLLASSHREALKLAGFFAEIKNIKKITFGDEIILNLGGNL